MNENDGLLQDDEVTKSSWNGVYSQVPSQSSEVYTRED